MNLLAFPCDKDLANHFCHRKAAADDVALILKKQESALEELLRSYGVRHIYALDEGFYGQITSDRSLSALLEIRNMGLTRSYFPLNDFCGNGALLLSVITPEVIGVNATSVHPLELELQEIHGSWTTLERDGNASLDQLEAEITKKLNGISSELTEIYPGNKAGEKPTVGLAQNFPYDFEVLSRYRHAGKIAEGKVLDIGSGLGYGAFLMVKLNSAIQTTGIDYDRQAVRISKSLWSDDSRLTFEVSQAETLPYENETFDTVTCFEVIEHVKRPDLLIREIRRVLKKKGKFIGSTPNFNLFPYRTNENMSYDDPMESRRAGIWPWHLTGFDERTLSRLVESLGFAGMSIKYSTYVKGLDLWERVRRAPFQEAVGYLTEVKWSVSDFCSSEVYFPFFSGYSFIFEAVRS